MEELPSLKEHQAFLETIPITIFPNPANNEVTITLQNTEYNTVLILTCFEMTGRKVYESEVQRGQKEMQLDVLYWLPGLYMAVVTCKGRVAGKERFVIMR
jgi:hypothetical protein